MSYLISRLNLEMRKFLSKGDFLRILSGPLKGYLWNKRISDPRYIIGIYETNQARLIIDHLGSSKRFVDIGANAGYYTLLASKYSPARHLALEPLPSNFARLKEHCRLNEVKHVDFLEAAVSASNGTVEFSDSGNDAANTYKTESTIYNDATITVKTLTLDQLASDYKLDGNVVLKIDVEGAEADVLEGGMNYLKSYHPVLLLATHDCHVAGVKEKCLEILKTLNYECKLVQDSKISGQDDFLCLYQGGAKQ